MKIRLSLPAELDLTEAADYYETSQPGLAEEFTDEFSETLARIKMAPKAGSPYDNITRYQMLHRFPYSVFYTEKNNEIVIVPVAHQHRKPGYWQGRVEEMKGNYISEPQADWPGTFEQVEEAQLRDMLKATPAQRLAMAEELANLVNNAHSAKPIMK